MSSFSDSSIVVSTSTKKGCYAVTHRSSAYMMLRVGSVVERLVVSVDVETDGDRTLPCGKPFLCFLYLLRSLFSST